jgi:hypothetical protein
LKEKVSLFPLLSFLDFFLVLILVVRCLPDCHKGGGNIGGGEAGGKEKEKEE